MALGKDETKVKLYGDNALFLKKKTEGAEWVDVGNVLADVNVKDTTDVVEVVLNDGYAIDIDDKRKVEFNVPLAQTGKDEIDLISDDSRDATYELAYGNGKVGGKTQVFYCAEVKIKHDVDIKTSDKPKKLMLMCSGRPQTSNVSIANSSLPASLQKPASSETFSGKNKFYAVIEF